MSLGYLKEFADRMDEEGPLFSGREPSLIDLIVAPFAVRLWLFDYFKDGLGISEEGRGGDDENSWSRWHEWLTATNKRKSIEETTSERRHYPQIYQR